VGSSAVTRLSDGLNAIKSKALGTANWLSSHSDKALTNAEVSSGYRV